jgi:hypothetical protein
MKPAAEEICCPPFDPAPWNGQIHSWKDKKFIRDCVFTLFYMPMNFGGVMRRTHNQVKEAGNSIPDYLCLSDHTSKWNMDVYLAVDKEITGAKNTSISGTFVSKVYEGPFKEIANWHNDFKNWCSTQNYKTVKNYMWYTTCPQCAKKYGKNYVVIFAEIDNQLTA